MLRRAARHRPTVALTAGVAAVLLLVAVGVSLFGSADASTTASTPTPSAAASTAPLASTLGAAAGDASLGLLTPYYEPAPAPNPSAPGITISAGADQPDPFIAPQDGRYYLFTSQDRVPANVPVRSGTVLGQWGPMTDALPDLPPWAETGNTWAPDVHKFGAHYILYFTAQLNYAAKQVMCIGDAISTRIDGPYISSPTPFVCQLENGGSIDPRTFVDADGSPYLIWKSDENSDGAGTEQTHIFSQRLSSNGEQLLGQPAQIFGPDQAWQGQIVEAPDLVLVKGAYELFYSGGWFNQAGYAIGVASCAGPVGPCADLSPTPLLGTNAQGAGPGEESVFSDATGVWVLYNPFASTLPRPGPPRPVDIARLGFGPDGPYLAAPLSTETG
jgi:beta-xylosidase